MRSLKLFTTIFLTILLFSGCDDKVVTQFYIKQDKGIELKTINLISRYPDIKNQIVTALKDENIKIESNSSYSIKVDYTDYKKVCNNPMTSAYDRTFSGFIRLTLLKNGDRIYMCQKEFRGELSADDFKRLFSLMKDDIDF